MPGLLISLIAAAIACLGGTVFLSWAKDKLDFAEYLGFSGCIGLGVLGLLTLAKGIIPDFVFILVFLALAVVGVLKLRNRAPLTLKWDYKVLLLIVPFFFPLISALAPSDMRDWDSLAYHLAVPKIWLQRGHIGFVQGIHHSNFPFTADMLYMWGLQWGGESGAKAFSLAWTAFGCLTLFGLARRWYGQQCAWIAPLGFIGAPIVLWEAGTAYIDVPHGLFCGLAALYLSDALKGRLLHDWLLSGIAVGFAMGTKHTGLQTFGAVIVVGLLGVLFTRQNSDESLVKPQSGWKGVVLMAVCAVTIAAPWYVKSVVMTGNPVYPFFYKQLGGKYWNEWRAEIYTREQKTFGVGTSPLNLGHAVLGLAYQPGRYVNPGQTQGAGFPTGSIGFAALLAGLLWCASGSAERREKIVLATVGLSLLMWFGLSQQSRYLTSVVVPLSVLAAGLKGRFKFGSLAVIGVVLQAAYSCWMISQFQTRDQVQVVTGTVSAADYQRSTVPFYGPAQDINRLSGTVKVALYDEVFGFFLDKPYQWANPGHSSVIPYEACESAQDWVAAMRRLGFTHAYVNMNRNFIDATVLERWQRAMSSEPYTAAERQEVRSNPDLWWRVLFADAVREGLLKPVQAFPVGATRPQSVLFEFQR